MSNALDSRILVVGSGGLGCELLKNLVLSGFRNISIVDFDRVAASNLNRQFLFRNSDVDRYKSEVAFERIMEWNASQDSNFYTCKVEDLGLDTLSQFGVILSAVDSLHTRRWLNSAFFDISRSHRDMILVDGGSQNLYGHVRVIKPGSTSCIECSLSLFTHEEPRPCVLTGNLKSAEDCINYSIYLDWELNDNYAQDRDPSEFLDYVYRSAQKLALSRNIGGVTRDLVDQIARKSIPNIATTNCIISALMVNVILNKDSAKSQTEDLNFYFYTGDGFTNLSKFALQPTEDCMVCQRRYFDLEMDAEATLGDLMLTLCKRLNSDRLSVSSDKGIIYLNGPEIVKSLYEGRLDLKLRLLVILKSTQGPGDWEQNLCNKFRKFSNLGNILTSLSPIVKTPLMHLV